MTKTKKKRELFSFPKTKRIKELLGKERLSHGIIACQGCGMEIAIRYVLRMLDDDAILFGVPGCSILMFMGTPEGSYTTLPWMMGAMTNIASMATGVSRYLQKAGKPGLPVVLAGDGCAADVGFQSLSGAAERGEKMLFVCLDNEGYMNTGMQRSSCTPAYSWTSTTPVGQKAKGKKGDRKYLPLIIALHNVAYTATASIAFLDDLVEKIIKAKKAAREGFAYLHIYCPCVTGWRFPLDKTIEVAKKAVDSNYFPLWESEYGRVFRFTYEPKKVTPVEDFLKLMNKFRHLTEQEIKEFKELVEVNYKKIKHLTEMNLEN